MVRKATAMPKWIAIVNQSIWGADGCSHSHNVRVPTWMAILLRNTQKSARNDRSGGVEWE
ncbi:hypothetical protein C5688_20295 [Methylocystis sp. MitZ-2018]|nr:hypothetical protein C5688_20295 [Methylocystis sp. MitZ-2018]